MRSPGRWFLLTGERSRAVAVILAPIAILITIAARITATARLRSPVSKNQRPGDRMT